MTSGHFSNRGGNSKVRKGEGTAEMGKIWRVVLSAVGIASLVMAQWALAGSARAAGTGTPPVSGFTLAPGSGDYNSNSNSTGTVFQQVATPVLPGKTGQAAADWTFNLDNTFASGDVLQIAVTPNSPANQCTTNAHGSDWVGFTASAAPTVTAATSAATTDNVPAFTTSFAFSGATFPPATSAPSGVCAGVTNLLSLTLANSASGLPTDTGWTVTVTGLQLSVGLGADEGNISVGAAYVPSGGTAAETVFPPTNATPPSSAVVGAMYPGVVNTVQPRNDDGSTAALPLGFNIDFFGQTFDSTYVNTNGNLTFESPYSTFTPGSIAGAGQPIIAPFWADVMTSAGGAPVVYGTCDAQSTSPDCAVFDGHAAFVADWPGVTCFETTQGGLDYFQVALVDRSDTNSPGQTGDNFDIYFNYDQVNWETGQASGGDANCLGGSSAHVGWSDGVNQTLELVGSGTNGAFLDNGPDALIKGSMDSLVPGEYVFPVRSGGTTGDTLTGSVDDTSGNPVNSAIVSVCGTGANAANCTTSPTVNGRFSVSGIADGAYTVSVNPPYRSQFQVASVGPVTVPCTGDQTATDGTTITCGTAPGAPTNAPDVPVVLRVPTPVPTGTTIDGSPYTGTPTIHQDHAARLVTHGCAGGTATATMSLPESDNPAVIDTVPNPPAPMTETPADSGTYAGTLPAADGYFTGKLHAHGTIGIVIRCPNNASPEQLDFPIFVDPSGVVFDSAGAPIQGARVTLLQLSNGTYTPVPDGSPVMSPANRNNPDTTVAGGQFTWETVPGSYEVTASYQGCSRTSAPFTVPPAVTNLQIILPCVTLSVPGSGGGGAPSAPGGGSSGPTDGATPVTTTGATPPAPPPLAPAAGCGAQPSPSAQFACLLYEAVLYRAPDAGGLSAVQQALAGGESHAGAARWLMSSAEYRADLVKGWYQSFLGRAADAKGLATFVGMLDHGSSDEQVMAELLASREFYSHAGGTSTGFLTAVYQDLLGRNPDGAGLNTYRTAPRATVIAALLSSAEYRTVLVSDWYRIYLHRAPDAVGLTSFVGMLRTNPDQAALAVMLGSPEFVAANS